MKDKEVNHKNGIRNDNRLENLEWVSRKRNAEHAYEIGKNSPDHLKKAVNQYTLDGEFVREWESYRECKRNGFNHVSECCRGKLKSCGGFIWRYK